MIKVVFCEQNLKVSFCTNVLILTSKDEVFDVESYYCNATSDEDSSEIDLGFSSEEERVSSRICSRYSLWSERSEN